MASFLSTRPRKKHICNADVLFSTKSAFCGRNLPSVDEIGFAVKSALRQEKEADFPERSEDII